MKTEREFIDSVYSKYELEKAKRDRLAKRNRAIYLYGGLAACFCFVVLGAFRILPGLLETNSAMEADGIMLVSTAARESYNGNVKEDVITYSLTDDAKSKQYYYTIDEEDKIYEEECVEEAIEAPMSVQTQAATGTKNSATIKQDAEYSDTEKAIQNVIYCSFDKSRQGVTEIIVDGNTVGRIYKSASLYKDESLLTGDTYTEGADFDENKVYVIKFGTDNDSLIVLSLDCFTDEEVREIEKSVQK